MLVVYSPSPLDDESRTVDLERVDYLYEVMTLSTRSWTRVAGG